MQSPTTAIIIDEHPLFRLGVRQALKDCGSIEIIGEGRSRQEAINLVDRLEPAIALIDISIAGDGIHAARDIHDRWPSVRIVMLTVSEDVGHVLAALEAGASGYVLKGIPVDDLQEILLAVKGGQSYLAPALGAQLFNAIRTQSQTDAASDLVNALSQKETEVFRHLGRGLGNRAIAESMGLPVRTIKFHVSRMLMKFQVKSRVEIALLAQSLQLQADKELS